MYNEKSKINNVHPTMQANAEAKLAWTMLSREEEKMRSILIIFPAFRRRAREDDAAHCVVVEVHERMACGLHRPGLAGRGGICYDLCHLQY